MSNPIEEGFTYENLIAAIDSLDRISGDLNRPVRGLRRPHANAAVMATTSP